MTKHYWASVTKEGQFRAACGRKGVRFTTLPAEVSCQSCIDTRLMRGQPPWSERVKAMAARFP